MTHVAVLGSVNLDIVASVARLPAPGETITGATLSRFPGGKGANQALASRRLGAEVTLLAQVGADAEADAALAYLRAEGVDLSRLCIAPALPTGLALIAVAESGDNQIVVAPGANATLAVGELPPADALICQLEVPRATVNDAARQFRGFFCVNLAPARDVDGALLQRADLVVVNETEARWYGDRLAAYSGYVARSLGARGAELRRTGELVASAAAPTVDVVDTTGAGDAFTAALTIALVEGQEPERALAFACAAGSAAARASGAQPSLPTRAEVESLL